MKKYLLLILIPIMFIANTIDNFAEDSLKKITVKTSAQCKTCKKTIEKVLKNTEGIESAELDVKSKELKVEFDESKINTSKIKELVNKAGYSADETNADEAAYSKLKECCKVPDKK